MIQASHIAALAQAVEKVFATMLSLEVHVQAPKIKQPGEPRLDVSGLIGLTGDMTGAVVLSFPMETARRVVGLFAGAPLEPGSADFADAIGELVNMVAGNAKAQFTGFKVSISCPSVIVGPGHQVCVQQDALTVAIPCTCDCGDFVLEVSLRPARVPEAAKAAAPVTATAS